MQATTDIRCKIVLPSFEGPLDLLLYLIRKEEIDIYDIPVAYVTKQYMSYLNLMNELDLEIAGEYLYIASVLVNIKARMLLPKPCADSGRVEDPREELTELLVEYQQFRNAGEYLRLRYNNEMLHFPTSCVAPTGGGATIISVPIDFVELMKSAWKLLKNYNRTIQIPPREEINIAERMDFIRRKLEVKQRITFLELFEKSRVSGVMFIGTFFALLELIRLKRVSVRQRNPFGNIWIYRAKAA